MQLIGVLGSGTWLRRLLAAARVPAEERRFFLAAWMLARPVAFALSTVGFPRLVRLLARLPPTQPRSSGVDVERAELLVKRAFVAAASDGACLPRAAVQYVVHRALGPEPRLVVGVSRGEAARGAELDWIVAAHAWVEARGGPRREPSFTPILAVTPSEGIVRLDVTG